ncbi:hypothetical protein [uncultured Sphingomonas sp.]|uniref:hypothetical protein n=1 Tax=uncultured Sphingomonas sp. TaxID=158754 RepID=UPI0030D8A549
MKREGVATVEGRAIGWTAAVLAVGPILVITQFAHGSWIAPSMFLLLLISMPFAFFHGAVPLAAGIVVGGWLGERRAAFRHPLVWVAVGVVGGWAMAPVVAGYLPGAFAGSLIAGGAAALIARRFVGWTEPVAPSPAPSYSRADDV